VLFDKDENQLTRE